MDQLMRFHEVEQTHSKENQLLGAKWIDILERDGSDDRYYKPSPHHVRFLRKGIQL